MPVLNSMTGLLAHRGPDAEGFHLDDRVALGHRRLTVIAPDGGGQPRIDAQSGDALVFNGEIYGFREHAEALRAEGVPLVDGSDTEVLFQLLRRFGVEAALERIDGMFAFAWLEGRTGTLHLARDRFGEKPLFWGLRNGTLVFGSEIKALQAHPLFADAEPDVAALDHFLSLEFVPGAASGWLDISKLRPGHRLAFGDGRVTVEPYWRRSYTPEPSITEGEALERLDALLHGSIRQRLIADVPVGVFLSGGVDSSLVAAVAREYSPSITAYTIGTSDPTFDETDHAEAVARHLGLDHVVRRLDTADVVACFDSLSGLIDDPLADYSLLPTHLVCRLARERETVVLGGDGADELFAGYASFRALRLAPFLAPLPATLGRALRWGMERLPVSEGYMNPTFVARQLSIGFGWRPEAQSVMWLAPFSAEEKARLWRRDVRPDDTSLPILAALLPPHAGSDLPTRVMDLYGQTYLPDDILTKVDRASMYVSLESRAPFLDRSLAEFAMSLPTAFKTGGGETKRILKTLASRYVPSAQVHRKKQGFGFPLGPFLREGLRERVEDILLAPSNPLFDIMERKPVERMVRDHMAIRKDRRKQIWALLVLSLGMQNARQRR